MTLFGYGDFGYACRVFPQPICNLFFRQLLVHPKQNVASSSILNIPSGPALHDYLNNAGLGVNPECTIPRMRAAGGSGPGNIANIIVCSIAIIVSFVLISHAVRRVAAVGRREIMILLSLYGLTAGAQLLDTGSFLRQGSRSITWLTGIHVGLVVVFFWTLLWNGILGFQWIDDGSSASLLPWLVGCIFLGVGSVYIALDTAFSISGYFGVSNAKLHNAWLFSLTVVWPLVATFIYFILITIICIVLLRELRPMLFFISSAFFMILGETARYALWHKICTGTSRHLDGSFLATLLETFAMCALYVGWVGITEDVYSDGQSTGFLV